ncbi:MAG TPA: glycosyltransferase family 2 protein [bacterium]|nr:glycosyltransferase family 2 protein [bacterium]
MTYIIILTWNGEKYLSKLFKSLQNLNYSQKKIKYIVIDSGSVDNSVKILEDLKLDNLKIFKLHENLGFAKGNNIGIKYALDNQADYVVLLNQDTYVEPDFLVELITVAESAENIGIVQPTILYYAKPEEINSLGNQLHFLGYGWCEFNHKLRKNIDLEIKNKQEITYASGAAVLYKTKMLQKIGTFDEIYFSYHEDSDICLRAKLQGFKTVLATKAICYHDYHFPTVKNKKRYFWMEKNRLYLILKFYQTKTLLLILPMMLIMDSGHFLASIKNRYLWQFIKAKLWFMLQYKHLLCERKKIQAQRIIGDRELLKNFASEIKYQETSNLLLNKIGNPLMKFYWQIIKQFI